MPEANFDGSPPVAHNDNSQSLFISPNLLRHITAGVTIFAECILVFSNVLPVLSITWIKGRLERTNLDLAILALSSFEILSVVIPAPIWMMHYVTGTWIGGKSVCLFYQAACVTMQLSSLLLAAHLCIERAVAGNQLRRKLKADANDSAESSHGSYLQKLHSLRTLLVTMVIFLLSAGVALLPAVFHLAPRDKHGIYISRKACVHWLLRSPQTWIESTFFLAFVTYVGLGLFFIVVCNIVITVEWIIIRQYKTASNLAELDGEPTEVVTLGFTSSAESERIKEFNQSRHIVAFITICILVTWIPALISAILVFAGFLVPGQFLVFALLSTTLSGIFHPFIYLAFSPSLRNGYRQVIYQISKKFLCFCCCKQGSNTEHSRSRDPTQYHSSMPLKREETTQFMLSMTSSSLQAMSDNTGDVNTENMTSQKFVLNNPSFVVSEEVEELLQNNSIS